LTAKRRRKRGCWADRENCTIDQPHAPQNPTLRRLSFHIQGVTVEEGGSTWKDTWPEMEQRGVGEEGEKPLSFWQRLMREEAKVGLLKFTGDVQVEMTLWTRPRLKVVFNLGDEDEAALFRECEIMVLSAGFHFRTIGADDRNYKG